MDGNTRILASGRFYIDPTQGGNGDSPAEHAESRPLPSASCAECLSFGLQLAAHSQPFGYHESPSSGGGGDPANITDRMDHGAGLPVNWQRGQRRQLPVLLPLQLVQLEVVLRNLLAQSQPMPALLPAPLCQPRFRRMQHPPPSVAAGPKPSGNGQRTWMPTLGPSAQSPPDWVDRGRAQCAPAGTPPEEVRRSSYLGSDEGSGQAKPVMEQALIPTAPLGSRLDLMRHSCRLSRQLLGGRKEQNAAPSTDASCRICKDEMDSGHCLGEHARGHSGNRDRHHVEPLPTGRTLHLAAWAFPRSQGFSTARPGVRPQWGAVAPSPGGQLDTCPWSLPLRARHPRSCSPASPTIRLQETWSRHGPSNFGSVAIGPCVNNSQDTSCSCTTS